MHGDKYSITLSKNGGPSKPLASWNGIANAKKSYANYMEWYRTSYQREDTEFTIELIDLETCVAIDAITLPIANVTQ